MDSPDPANPLGNTASRPVQVCRVHRGSTSLEPDALAIEEPLEIRLLCDNEGRRVKRAISITMRTPGHDVELAAGFLFTEGILIDAREIARIGSCGGANIVCVDLHSGVVVDLARLERHFYAASSCGVCGKSSLDALCVPPRVALRPKHPVIDAETIYRLPAALRSVQAVFNRTGGLHAAALFDAQGRLHEIREDVGRHNALDKLIGSAFLAGRTPLADAVLLVSGRVSFELVQKAAMAGIGVLAAVGAPSSLAIDLARTHGMTIVGFIRPERFNLYTGAERIHQAQAVSLGGDRLPLSLSVV